MTKINKILLFILLSVIVENIFLFAYLRNIRLDFYNNVDKNIAAHIITGRLDLIKRQFKLLKKYRFPLDIDPEWIYQATISAHPEILEYIFENGINLKLEHDALPLVAIFRNNDAQTIRLLIKYGLKFSAEDLSVAAYWGSFEIVQTILNANKFSKKDYTDALFASLSFCPNKKIVEILLKNGADPSSKNQNPFEEAASGKTPIEIIEDKIKTSDRKEEWKEIRERFEER